MVVVGGQRGDEVSYAKQEDLKVHPMKGRWRAEESRELLVFVGFSPCQLLWISFY